MFKKLFIIACIFSLLFVSCGTTEQEPETIVETPAAPVTVETEETEPAPVIPAEVEIEEPAPEEPVFEEAEEVEEPEDEIYEIDEVEDIVVDFGDEFTRSTNEMEDVITLEEFNEDKAAILQNIYELDEIMSNFEFDNWKKHIAQTSLEYYSNPLNLRKAQKKLPDKSIQLKGLRDYFKYVFIPSRKQSQVDEIRYISKTYIKAVEVREEEDTTVVYYYFIKDNGKWYVHLPQID